MSFILLLNPLLILFNKKNKKIMNEQDSFFRLISETKTPVKEISPQALKELFSTTSSFILIDVRENDEWANGHIAQAFHLPRADIEQNIQHLVANPKTPLVVYCGAGYRSALACETLQKMGYQNAASLTGGIKGWLAVGGTLI